VEEQLKRYLSAWIEGVARGAAEAAGAQQERTIRAAVTAEVKRVLIPRVITAGGVVLGGLVFAVLGHRASRKVA
jgi:hypothetical protein